jgi:hypothetical protein
LRIDILGGLGAHTYTSITKSDGFIATYSSHKDKGKNVVSRNHDSDTSPHLDYGSVVIPPPLGMTQSQWDNAVIAQGESMIESEPLDYELSPDSDQPNKGNCHTTTRNLINGAGGEIPKGYDPKALNPDLHGNRKTRGFGSSIESKSKAASKNSK